MSEKIATRRELLIATGSMVTGISTAVAFSRTTNNPEQSTDPEPNTTTTHQPDNSTETPEPPKLTENFPLRLVETENKTDERFAYLSPDVITTKDLTVGQQIRVQVPSGAPGVKYTSAAYTVDSLPAHLDRENTVQLSSPSLDRITTNNPQLCSIYPSATNPNYNTLSEADTNNEYVESTQLGDTRPQVIITAPHGGYIEENTAEQAQRTASFLDSDLWWSAGFNSGGGAFERWHITSTLIHLDSFPALNKIHKRPHELAVSYHGQQDPGIAIGGLVESELKFQLKDNIDLALEQADVSTPVTVHGTDAYHGSSKDNYVNWLTETGYRGLQIEQSRELRENQWTLIADAVSKTIESYLETPL